MKEIEMSVKQILPQRKKIALIAHDNRKKDLLRWAVSHKEKLSSHELCGTGTTANLIAKGLGVEVEPYCSGPFGGDLQIGAGISQNQIHMMIFFWDPLAAQPHDPDVKALLRVSALYNIPVANNEATADFILSSPYFQSDYERYVVNYDKIMKNRVQKFL